MKLDGCFRIFVVIERRDDTCHASTYRNEGHVDWSAGAIVKKTNVATGVQSSATEG